MIVANTSTVPIALASGRSLAPGERGEAAPNAEEQAQLDSGALTAVPAEPAAPKEARRTTTKEEVA